MGGDQVQQITRMAMAQGGQFWSQSLGRKDIGISEDARQECDMARWRLGNSSLSLQCQVEREAATQGR